MRWWASGMVWSRMRRFDFGRFYRGILLRTRFRSDRLIGGGGLGSGSFCCFVEREDSRRMASSASSPMEQGSTVPQRKLGRQLQLGNQTIKVSQSRHTFLHLAEHPESTGYRQLG